MRCARFELLPGFDAPFPTNLSGAHHYAARGVATTPLRTRSGLVEKTLIYLGVGIFDQPLEILRNTHVERPGLELKNRGDAPIGTVLSFENR